MDPAIIQTRRLNLFYGDFHALTDIDIDIEEQKITALIGPSGCGKSTLVRVFNRMNDLIDGTRVTGDVRVHNENIYAPNVDLIALRSRFRFQCATTLRSDWRFTGARRAAHSPASWKKHCAVFCCGMI